MAERQTIKSRAGEIFIRADKQWESGNLRSAFRLMVAAAKMGDVGAQVNVGYMYDTGVGVKHNRQAAFYWYRRAYRRGDGGAASNIGTIFRDEGNLERALYWFQRAKTLRGGDDGDADLEIAKLYLRNSRDVRKAILHLKRVCRSKFVTQDGVEQARRLLRRTMRKLNQ
jgi:TPR repeat protein